MIDKHVRRSFSKKTLTLLLLGIVIALSSFVYTAVFHGAQAVEDATLPYLERTNQEDFMFDINPFLSDDEKTLVLDTCGLTSRDLDALYLEDRSCFNTVIFQRKAFLETQLDVSLELRLFSDAHIEMNDESHRVRFFKDARAINLSEITDGQAPQNIDEIAILKHYALHHDLTIGDEITMEGRVYTISGFVLFPDYNLPVIDHMLMFGTQNQTLALVHDDVFETRVDLPQYVFSGVFEDEPFTSQGFYQDHDDLSVYVQTMTLTENNVRSGAIYDEIAGSYAAGLFMSVLIAVIGIVIATLMMRKHVEHDRKVFGLLKALGYHQKALIGPYLKHLIIFSLSFLLLGYFLGYVIAPWFRDLYLSFYLLPEAQVRFSLMSLFVAVLVPFVVLNGFSLLMMYRLLNKPALTLIETRVEMSMGPIFKGVKTLTSRLFFTLRMQITFMTRQFSKVVVYVLGIMFAVYLSFLAISMLDVFDETVEAYYNSTDIRYMGYMPLTDDDVGEKALEIQAVMNHQQTQLIGLSDDQQLHPLSDETGRDLLEYLKEGLVLSKSFALMSGLTVGDAVDVHIGQTTLNFDVLAIADIYPGTHVFTDRSLLAEAVYEDEHYYNVVYAQEALDQDAFHEVFSVDRLLSEVEQMNDLVLSMLYLIVGVGLFVGFVIVYLLSLLLVDDHDYHISILKVLGYHPKEAYRLLLGGYQWLNVVVFMALIPLSQLSFNLITQYFAHEYQFVLPLSLKAPYVLVIAALYGIIFMIATTHAKQKVKRVSLSKALKLYQV